MIVPMYFPGPYHRGASIVYVDVKSTFQKNAVVIGDWGRG